MKFLKIASLMIILFVSILLPVNINGKASAYPQIVSTSPSAADANVPVDTDIRIAFNEKILSVNSSNITVSVRQNGYWNPLSIKEYRKNDKELILILQEALEFNKDYRVELFGASVNLQNGVYNQNLAYTFQTNYMPFYELMVLNEKRLSNLLNTYSPRQIKAFAPERYIEDVNIFHKKQGALQEGQASTEGLTNIDIRTKSEKVKYVHVDIMRNGKVIKKGYANKATITGSNTQNSLLFDIGFTGIPDFYDVRITAMDSSQNKIDQQIIKFATEDEKVITQLKQPYKFETAGNGYSFYDLLEDEKLFSTFLAESPISDLKVQVEER